MGKGFHAEELNDLLPYHVFCSDVPHSRGVPLTCQSKKVTFIKEEIETKARPEKKIQVASFHCLVLFLCTRGVYYVLYMALLIS
jgi:hypothetical protein